MHFEAWCLDGGNSCTAGCSCFTPLGSTLIPIMWEAGWAPDTAWTPWETGEFPPLPEFEP